MRDALDSSRPTLHVEVIGSGHPMVLAHGLGGSARNFRPQAQALKQLCKLILFDARGHARSEAPISEQAYTLAALARDMSCIVDEYAAGSAILGGLSLGAITALQCAINQPSQAQALIVASLPGSNESRRVWAIEFAAAIDREGLEQAGARFVWGGGSRFDAPTAELIRRGWLEHAPHAIAHLLRQTVASMPALLDQEAALERLVMPVLIIAGSKDRDAVAAGEKLAARLSRSRFEVIEGAGHVVNLENSQQFNAHMSAFVQSLDPREIEASR